MEEHRMLESEQGSDFEVKERASTVATRAPWRKLAAAAGVLAATATVGVLSYGQGRSVHFRSSSFDFTGLSDDEGVMDDDPCLKLPFVRLEKVITSNLGGYGPDKEAEEGIIYSAKAFRTGTPEDVEVHLHAISEYIGHDLDEGSKVDPEYHPAWSKENGISGHFGAVNLRPGSNVTLRVHGYDPATKKDITMPKLAMTFFDLDTGKDTNYSVEYIKMSDYIRFFHTNTTEVKIRDMEEGSTLFTASEEGTGKDNPKDPLELTILQKNRVVSFEYKDADEIQFEVGATPGETARVFMFVVRPALRCAWTKMKDGTLMAANDKNTPFTIVEGRYGHHSGVAGVGPAFATLALVFLAMFSQ